MPRSTEILQFLAEIVVYFIHAVFTTLVGMSLSFAVRAYVPVLPKHPLDLLFSQGAALLFVNVVIFIAGV